MGLRDAVTTTIHKTQKHQRFGYTLFCGGEKQIVGSVKISRNPAPRIVEQPQAALRVSRTLFRERAPNSRRFAEVSQIVRGHAVLEPVRRRKIRAGGGQQQNGRR